MKKQQFKPSNEFSKQVQSAQSPTSDTSYCAYNRVIVFDDRIIVKRESVGSKEINYNEKSLANLKDNKVKGKLSTKSYLHVRKHLVAWLKCLEYNKNHRVSSSGGVKHYPTMITLTLSAIQKHDDKLLKRHLFGRFIEWIKAKYDVKYYFIRYEAQSNGNIHGHLIVDRYVSMHEIRENWNRILNRLGYVDDFEEKYKHRNPPSTHVEVLGNTTEGVNYMIGYVMKKCKNRPIQGRQYGMSDELKEMLVYDDVIDNTWSELLDKIENDTDVYKHHDKFYSVYVFRGDFIQKYALSWLYQDMCTYYLGMFKRFYGNIGYEFN